MTLAVCVLTLCAPLTAPPLPPHVLRPVAAAHQPQPVVDTADEAPGPGLTAALHDRLEQRWYAQVAWDEAQRRPQNSPTMMTMTGDSRTSTSSRNPRSDTGSSWTNVAGSIRACESGNDYSAVSADGTYTGAFQFDDRTWRSVGGTGRAGDAPPAEQDMRARMLYDRAGRSPWPVCGR